MTCLTVLGLPLLLLLLGASAEQAFVKLSNGVDMPLAAMGVWQYSADEAAAAIPLAFQAGFTHIDTANDYNNQEGVGRAIKAFPQGRANLFLTTKVPGCGTPGQSGFLTCKNAYEGTKKFLEANLVLLDQNYTDLVLVHFPPIAPLASKAKQCEYVQQQWRAMEEFYAANKTRAIGVSSYCPFHLECLQQSQTVPPMVNQVELHVGMGTDPGTLELLKYCQAAGVVAQAWSPLGDGDGELITGDLVSGIATAHGKASGATVALKWIAQQGVGVVTKASTLKYLQEDFDLWDWELTAAEMAVLSASVTPAGNHKKCLA